MMAWPDPTPAAARYYTTTSPPCCSCPQWRYRPSARPCKHVKALADAEALVAAQAAKWVEREATG